MGARISDLRAGGKPVEADRRYKVAGWAPVAEGASGEPVWDVVTRYLRDRKTVAVRTPYTPRLVGVSGNAGLA
jgi:sulfur-oxidizing protein SoxB